MSGEETVAADVIVVGAGMAGLSAARWLGSEGMQVVVLEAHDALGGQWRHDNPRSGVWPSMRTNTARFLTRPSDAAYPAGTPMFPRNQDVLALLERWALEGGVTPRIRLGADVHRVAPVDGGYEVGWSEVGRERVARVPRVVVASGRYHRPEVVPVPGLDHFTGSGGVHHAFGYDGPERWRGLRVAVCGGSISALEVAGDLAMGGAARVHVLQRRQRYVMPKMVTGTPIESYVFTRGEAIDLAHRSVEELRAATAARVLALGGDPARYGAPSPHPDIMLAGVAGSPHYLNLVAEDRIAVHGWPDRVAGDRLVLADGEEVSVDAVVMATGFDLDLDFLDPAIRTTARVRAKSVDLADFTFHPDLPGLAFLGLWAQLGPYAVPLELQARWVAYTWSGALPTPTREDLAAAVRRGVAEGHGVGYREQHEMALRFGRLAGVDPTPERLEDPELLRVLPHVTHTADVFRLVGRDADPAARDRVLADFARHAPPEVLRDLEDAVGAGQA